MWDGDTHIPGGCSPFRFTSLEIPSVHNLVMLKHSRTYESDEWPSWLPSRCSSEESRL